jgi:hypothetical protein
MIKPEHQPKSCQTGKSDAEQQCSHHSYVISIRKVTWPTNLLASQREKPTFANVIDLLIRGSEVMDIVALSVTEHLPWDAEKMRMALAQLPVLSR